MKIAVLAIAAVLAFASVALAAPIINVGSQSLTALSPSQIDSFGVFVSGGDLIIGETLFISIGDEGNGFAGAADPGEPKIVSVDIISGTIFEPNNTGQSNLINSDEVVERETTTSSDTVSASGKLFTITIDRNGAPTGSTWDLRAVFILVPGFGGPYNSEYHTQTSSNNPFAGTNGTFQYAAEPSTIALAVLGFIGLVAWGWRRRQSVDRL